MTSASRRGIVVATREGVTISHYSHGDGVVLELTGGLTLTDGVETLRGRILELLDAGHTRIAIDLSRVPDLDSAGLGELVRSYVTAHRRHGDICLLNVPPHVRTMLTVTRLATVLPCREGAYDGGAP